MSMYGGMMNNVFELFSSHHITADHRVYCYSHTETKMGGVAIPFASFGDTKMKTDKLFVLINVRTNLVVDHTYMPHGS